MPFLTSFEIDGMLKMGHKNVIQILETRFGNLSENLKSDKFFQGFGFYKKSCKTSSYSCVNR